MKWMGTLRTLSWKVAGWFRSPRRVSPTLRTLEAECAESTARIVRRHVDDYVVGRRQHSVQEGE